jgi:hypothetical protein
MKLEDSDALATGGNSMGARAREVLDENEYGVAQGGPRSLL